MKKIISFVGMPGSGKGTCTDYMAEIGYDVIHFGNIVTQDEIPRRGLELNAANEKIVREDLRANGGMGVLAELVVKKIETLTNDVVILDGLYSWSEFKILSDEYKEKLVVVAVFTPKSVRYSRLAKRTYRPLTESETISRDIAEIENLEKGGPIAFADYLLNNTSSTEDLKSELDNLLKAIL